jgi:hypothetical protein
VLEEVSEAGASFFDFLPRAHADHAVVRDEARAVESDSDELEAVREVPDVDMVGKHFALLLRKGGGLGHEKESDEGGKFHSRHLDPE